MWADARFRDDTCFAAWQELPLFFWDSTRDVVWILVERPQSTGRRPIVRVVESDAAGTWTARDVPPGEDGSLPADVRAAQSADFWSRRELDQH